MTSQNRLKSTHQNLYEFIVKYSMRKSLFGKNSPKPLRIWRYLIFLLYVSLGALFVITYQLNIFPWNIITGIALLVNAVVMIWVYQKTLKLIQQDFHSMIFKKRYELEHYIKIDLGLGKKAIESNAEICFHLSERHKKKYYKLELPLGSLAIAVSILAVAKNITVKDLSELAILIGLAIFGFWNLFANLATTVDQKSDRYFELYLLLKDMDYNKEYKKLKKQHLIKHTETEELEDVV